MAKKFVLGELSESHEAVTKIKDVLEKATKQKIAVTIIDKLVKKAGVATKKITFNFEEGQAISLVIRNDGDVIQHFLNSKNIPLFRVMDFDKQNDFNAGLEDLALKLKSNQDKFNLKRMSARVIIPRNKAPLPTVRKRIQQARDTLKELDEELANKNAQLKQKRAEMTVLNNQGATSA